MSFSDKYKQVIVIRTDLKMSAGKKCAQACHASLSAADIARLHYNKVYSEWKKYAGQKKVVLKIRTEESIEQLYNEAKSSNIPCYLVADAGLTQLEPGTVTALGIGPYFTKEIDKLTGNLKLL
ncbi:MAG: peptidyl-tRNA hydrolase [Candidatus Lokiarchaeota archaeon]|nr:peptidyl-tRNA hydrolase [Candidatus Lokiarchaeota archaeon]